VLGADGAVDVQVAGVLLGVAAVLALVAGYVDAVCFDRIFGVFPANQSGNAVLLGIGLGEGRGGEAWRPAVAIIGFAFGIVLAIVLGSRVRRRHRPALILGSEVLLLVPLTVVLLDTAHPASELSGVASGVLLVLTACAMGLQTEVIRRVAGVGVATTYQSGAIARLAELLAQRATPDAVRPAAPIGPGLVVLGLVLVAYIAGAAFGAALGDWRPTMLVPSLVLVIVGMTVSLVPRIFEPSP
jgi:uncharacterized membrane protein YoaK (UPF0700 family)